VQDLQETIRGISRIVTGLSRIPSTKDSSSLFMISRIVTLGDLLVTVGDLLSRIVCRFEILLIPSTKDSSSLFMISRFVNLGEIMLSLRLELSIDDLVL